MVAGYQHSDRMLLIFTSSIVFVLLVFMSILLYYVYTKYHHINYLLKKLNKVLPAIESGVDKYAEFENNTKAFVDKNKEQIENVVDSVKAGSEVGLQHVAAAAGEYLRNHPEVEQKLQQGYMYISNKLKNANY